MGTERHVGLLRALAGFLLSVPARDLPVVAAGVDLASRGLGRGDRRCLFLDPGCAFDLRVQAARCRLRLGVLGLCSVHHGMRLHPCVLDRNPVGADLWHRGLDQGDDGAGLDHHRAHAVAAVAEGAGAAVVLAASRYRACAGAGRHAAARGRRHAASRPEDGRDRPIDRRRRTRLQQPAHHHHRQSGDRRPQPQGLGRGDPRAARSARQC